MSALWATTSLSTGTDTATMTPTLTITPTTSGTISRTPTSSRTKSPTRTPSLTKTQTPTRTITNTGTLPTATPHAPAHIVISEFRTIGPLGANDEFVELYNPTGLPVNIGTWTIYKSSTCGTSILSVVSIYYGTVLMPGQHYLVASYASYSSITN